MITLQPTLNPPFKWNPNPKQPKTILKFKNQHFVPPPRPSSSSGKTKRSNPTKKDKNITPNAFPKDVKPKFIKTLTELCKERLNAEYEVLDLMCSSVSHLPKEVTYKKVVGHVLNAKELAKNPRLDDFVVNDLNKDQRFEFENASFDAVLCTASVQYLQEPEKVFAEVLRLLRPDGVFIVSLKNETEQVQLVVKYFKCVEGFTEPEIVQKAGGFWSKVINKLKSKSDNFCAVIAYKKPIHK